MHPERQFPNQYKLERGSVRSAPHLIARELVYLALTLNEADLAAPRGLSAEHPRARAHSVADSNELAGSARLLA